MELAQNTEYVLNLGIDHGVGNNPVKTLTKALQGSGANFVLRKASLLGVASLRLKLRKLGVRFSKFLSLQEVAYTYGLDHWRCININSPASLDRLQEANPDLIIVAAFSQIIRQEVISIPEVGIINIHPSLLPKYRGPNPFYWVLANGESHTGVSIHHIDTGVDSGDIILQEEIPISPRDNEISLRRRSIPVACRLLREAIRSLSNGNAPRISQTESEATYFSHPPRGKSRL